MRINRYVLASGSPRRQSLLKSIISDFEIWTKDIEESYPSELKEDKVAIYLAEKKAKAFYNEMNKGDLLISADTIVCQDQRVLGKPKDADEAFAMLTALSNSVHKVITACAIQSLYSINSFAEITEVRFKALSSEEIDYYIEHFKPFDKAGAYGIQEWIGQIAIKGINGCYYNVMGLPIQRLNSYLKLECLI
tara:strand:+ start:90 stop:665 length:576 start_codon:yes stop_codon:yes gene_type:complete